MACGELIASKLGRQDFRTELDEFSCQTLQKVAVGMREAGLVPYSLTNQASRPNAVQAQ